MILKRSLKYKLKKFLFVLPILIVIFSLSFLHVSALTGNFFDVPLSQPPADDNFGYIECCLYNSNEDIYRCLIIVFNTVNFLEDDTSNNQIDVYVDVSQYSITLTPFSSLNNSPSISAYTVQDVGNFYLYGWSDSITIDYQPSWEFVCVHCYGPSRFRNVYDSSVFSDEFFIVNYGNTAAMNQNLATIISILRNKNNNDIISNANQNAQDIQANQDKNASDIQANQDKNTSEILNGWQSDEDVSSGESDNLASIEDELITGNQQAAEDEMSNVNDNILGSLQRLYSSFGAAGSLFRDLTVRVPDFSVLVYFSLAIGVLPLIVGLSINGLRSSDRSSARQRQEAAYKRGYNSGYTRGKGG